jgi:cell division protein FtsB
MASHHQPPQPSSNVVQLNTVRRLEDQLERMRRRNNVLATENATLRSRNADLLAMMGRGDD